jgi:acyl dehydratase
LWQDEEYARKSQYGGIIAPPTFILTVGFEQIQQRMGTLMPDVGRLHGGTELEYYQPVRPGDKITASVKMVDVRERMGGKLGRLVFVTFELVYKNQRQEEVARCRQITILYQTEGTKYA